MRSGRRVRHDWVQAVAPARVPAQVEVSAQVAVPAQVAVSAQVEVPAQVRVSAQVVAQVEASRLEPEPASQSAVPTGAPHLPVPP
jgi:hypothetical protein